MSRTRSRETRLLHAAMATEFWLRAVHADVTYVRQAAQAAWDELDRLEATLSRFVGSSDVARLNRLPPGGHVLVHPDTYACLVVAERVARETAGAFDVAFRSVPRRPGHEAFRLDSDRPGVTILEAGVQLDLGGIGKGYALDCIRRLLQDWELDCLLLGASASTVVATTAPPGTSGWTVHFGRGRQRSTLFLTQSALSGSGVEVKGPHVLDPRTGTAASRPQAWAQAATAAEADALSTAALILSDAELDALRRRCPDVHIWR